jgi:hypothetical protein
VIVVRPALSTTPRSPVRTSPLRRGRRSRRRRRAWGGGSSAPRWSRAPSARTQMAPPRRRRPFAAGGPATRRSTPFERLADGLRDPCRRDRRRSAPPACCGNRRAAGSPNRSWKASAVAAESDEPELRKRTPSLLSGRIVGTRTSAP